MKNLTLTEQMACQKYRGQWASASPTFPGMLSSLPQKEPLLPPWGLLHSCHYSLIY